MSQAKTVWLIGASDGIGAALARRLADEGYRLALSARDEAKMRTLQSALAGSGHCVAPLDVRDAASVRAAWRAVCEWAPSGPDIFIYCAGAYEPMSAGAFDLATVEKIMDVNATGAFRALDCVLPVFLGRNAGHIVLVGSVAGYRGLANAFGYGASKAALNHLAENLKLDLARTAIKVQRVCPGFVKTRLTDKNDFSMPFLITAEDAARRIARGLTQNRFEIAFPLPMKLIAGILALLPSRLYLWLMKFAA